MGIYLNSCNDNSVSGNNITANGWAGIWFIASNSNSVSGNNITANNLYGIVLEYSSSNNSVSGNNITANNGYGIALYYSSNNNTMSENNIANNEYNLCLDSSNNNSVSGNNIASDMYGIHLYYSSDNSVTGNGIANNEYGIVLDSSNNNMIYHNNFMNNINQVVSSDSTNVWDDDYPSGGNHWSDYAGVDLYSGPYQNQTGSDGVGDTPYVIDGNNRDNYPHMKPCPWADVGITSVTASKNTVGQGYNVSINVMMFNYGIDTETFNVTAYYGNGILTPVAWDVFWSMGDVNRDGFINQADLDIIGANFGWLGPPGANLADINNDGKVDGKDIAICAKHYGYNIWKYFLSGDTIGTEAVTNMPSRSSTSLTFTWNTTGIAYGNYIISAYAWPLPGEINMADNTFTGGWIKITIVGDVNGDGKVNIIDTFSVALAYGSYPGHPTWNPNYDINNDGKINLIDYFITALNYGKTSP